jgi:hypothetical protein
MVYSAKDATLVTVNGYVAVPTGMNFSQCRQQIAASLQQDEASWQSNSEIQYPDAAPFNASMPFQGSLRRFFFESPTVQTMLQEAALRAMAGCVVNLCKELTNNPSALYTCENGSFSLWDTRTKFNLANGPDAWKAPIEPQLGLPYFLLSQKTSAPSDRAVAFPSLEFSPSREFLRDLTPSGKSPEEIVQSQQDRSQWDSYRKLLLWGYPKQTLSGEGSIAYDSALLGCMELGNHMQKVPPPAYTLRTVPLSEITKN